MLRILQQNSALFQCHPYILLCRICLHIKFGSGHLHLDSLQINNKRTVLFFGYHKITFSPQLNTTIEQPKLFGISQTSIRVQLYDRAILQNNLHLFTARNLQFSILRSREYTGPVGQKPKRQTEKKERDQHGRGYQSATIRYCFFLWFDLSHKALPHLFFRHRMVQPIQSLLFRQPQRFIFQPFRQIAATFLCSKPFRHLSGLLCRSFIIEHLIYNRIIYFHFYFSLSTNKNTSPT